MQREHRSGIEACASGIPKLAAGTWRELISSPQPPLAELISSSRHFWAGSRHQHVAAFPWGTRHLAAADAYGTHKLAAALAGGNHNHDAPACNTNHMPIAAVAGRSQKLPAAAFWRQSAARFRSMHAWTQLVGPLLHPGTCCGTLGTRTRRAELCMCRMGPPHAITTPIRHQGMCEWDPEARHWHFGGGNSHARLSLAWQSS